MESTIRLHGSGGGNCQAVEPGLADQRGARRGALECALCQARIKVGHLAGVDSEVADALSRMWGPTPTVLPGECKDAKEVTVPSRGGDYWLLPRRVTEHC